MKSEQEIRVAVTRLEKHLAANGRAPKSFRLALQMTIWTLQWVQGMGSDHPYNNIMS